MISPIAVWISERDDARVGTLYPHRKRGSESATFTYHPDYVARPGAYGVDPVLPLSNAPHHTAQGHALFGAFTDCAPDRWGRTLILRAESRSAREESRTARALSELDFLVGVRDDLRQGALRFADAAGNFLASDATGVPALTDLPSLLALADHAERDTASLPDLQRLVHASGSLGGARPKAHATLPGGALAIAKFPSIERDTWDVMAWERVLTSLAADAGIAVPPSQLVRLTDRSVFVTERFDQRVTTRGTERVGQGPGKVGSRVGAVAQGVRGSDRYSQMCAVAASIDRYES